MSDLIAPQHSPALEAMPTIHDQALSLLYSLRVEVSFLVVTALLWWLVSCFKRQSARSHSITRKGDVVATKSVAKHRTTQNLRGVEARHSKTQEATPRSFDTAAVSDYSSLVNADKALLADPAWMVPRLRLACKSNSSGSIAALRQGLAAGLDLKTLPQAERDDLLGTLVVSAIRNGFVDDATQMAKELQGVGIPLSVGLCTSAVKLCTSKQLFKDALLLYDTIVGETPVELFDRAVWSCLLYCCVEAGFYTRGVVFFERMRSCGAATQKDYWNMVRIHAAGGKWQDMVALIKDVNKSGCQADSVIYNTALATCVSEGQIEVARALLDEMYEMEGLVDVITYNTLLKGYAKSGAMTACFELFQLMKERNVQLSQVTYGTVLDGCINAKNTDMATHVFDLMVAENIPMNCVLYTTLIKGFAREGKADEAMRIYSQMVASNIKPDLITFSLLLKVHCDAARLDVAFELLEAMLRSGLTPDEVIFNNLLMGCANESNTLLAKRIYGDMVDRGIKPSNATLSILLRVFSDRNHVHEAFEILKEEPQKHKIEVEPRLFCQFIQLCLRHRRGRLAVESYELFFRHDSPSRAAHASMLSNCMKLNMCETACDIITKAADQQADVDVNDILMVRDAAARKGKESLVEACDDAMRKLGSRKE